MARRHAAPKRSEPVPHMPRKPRTPRSVAGVATADRVLSILTAFRRGDGALELAELAARTGLVKSTIMRLAISLERYGFLMRQPDGSYRLGAEVLRLGSIFQQSLNLEAHVLPVLQQLVDDTGESASFYVRHGNQRLCLYRVDSPHRLRLHVRPGDMLPMDRSAIGRVLRAFEKWPDDAAAAEIEVPVFSSGAADPHTAALAIPVFGADSRLIGALAVSGPVTRLTAKRAQEVKPVLHSAGVRLTTALGGRMPTEVHPS